MKGQWKEDDLKNALAALMYDATPPSYRRSIYADVLAQFAARAAAEERAAALAAIAHDLADKEHGARCEQISALARLGIVVTRAEHLQRADDYTAAQHQRIDAALGDAAPATREETTDGD